MASSKKSVSEKRSKETKTKKKPSKESTKKKASKGSSATRKNDKKKTTNGAVNDDEVPPTPSSSSDSQAKVENGIEVTQNGTSNKKPKKGKRERKEEFQEKEDAKMNRFPMERVRRIIRSEDSDMRISNEAVFLVNKATEKFLEKFCGDAYASAVKDRKKSLAYKHLSSVVNKRKRYDFLSDFVPEKVKAEDALAERKLLEPEAA
ncbi:Transcription initiation factor [Parasponia andersonii]|uniref:Transcription initiation factor n=1 Tax=Parasponia andersonii TaxID=3476 RepID=A0A2P5DEY0_PARAD|nr:Transcription initiation factor [Parasponia andersonii]